MNYPYANGIIKSIEGNLLDKVKFTKLAKTEKSDFVSTLIALGYGNGTAQEQLIDVINNELVTLKKLLQEISPEPQYTDLFYMTYDATNLKVLYKEKIFSVTRPDILVGMGAIDVHLLQEAVSTNDFSQLPKQYQHLLVNLSKSLSGINNPRQLSAVIDDQVFSFVFRAIRGSQGGALKSYFQAYVDFANVVTLVRSRVLMWEPQVVSEMLIHGGKIPLSVYEAAYLEQGDAFPRAFLYDYEEKITKALKKYQESPNLDKLERTFDALTLEIVSKFRFDAFGIGPIIYYFLKKLAEAKNIRRIYAESVTDISDLLQI
jgi:V/A-type H+/Na+-transporting ATPase subunit C